MDKKNVLLISCDHWAGNLLGCEGHKVIMTPTLDTLAKNGIRFENYYTECPSCIPARRTMMTGMLPKNHGDRVYKERLEMPDAETLADCFHNAGYQTYCVGKLHVYPQRDRIGFDDVILMEEGRTQFGVTDDYETWLGEHGYTGQEALHGESNNLYYTRPWHLPEEAHPTTWATKEIMHQIKRRDPKRPSFFYLSYQFPHPPIVPLQTFLDYYTDEEIEEPHISGWEHSEEIFKKFTEHCSIYNHKDMIRARRAFYAQCSHIDNQIRLVIGTLRECGMLNDTIIVFTSDHGDMLFDHDMVAKSNFYENSARVPLIISGAPIQEKFKTPGKVVKDLGEHADLMPTLLDLCGIKIPETVDGISLFGEQKHDYVYGEMWENYAATRMIRTDKYKFIYYPFGNVMQLFDMENDRNEDNNLAKLDEYKPIVDEMEQLLIKELNGEDLNWIKNGKLVGIEPWEITPGVSFDFMSQRGYHWPI